MAGSVLRDRIFALSETSKNHWKMDELRPEISKKKTNAPKLLLSAYLVSLTHLYYVRRSASWPIIQAQTMFTVVIGDIHIKGYTEPVGKSKEH